MSIDVNINDDPFKDKEVVIDVQNITKKFKIFFDKGSQLKERLLFRNRNRYEVHEVLRGVSFQIRKGEAWGLIGENGCGKSTTLKMLTRIMYPDSGTINIKGRVSSLLELGAGFHPDMSGRENIYTNAAIFGLTRKEIEERLDDIIEFSELGKYIDNPVRTYSSGMYMRLAFSVAINVDADILFVDEILAVGDANFQAKCFNKMREIKAKGTTIVIVSHSLGQIEQICNKTVWIADGLIKEMDEPRIVHAKYMEYMGQKRQAMIDRENAKKEAEAAAAAAEAKAEEEKAAEENKSEATPEEAPKQDNNRAGNRNSEITKIGFVDESGTPKTVFATGDNMIMEFDYKVNKPTNNVAIGISVFRGDGLYCYATNTRIDRLKEFNFTKDGKVKLKLDHVNLLPGQYTVDVTIEEDNGNPVDQYKNACNFEIYSNVQDAGVLRLDHEWIIEGAEFVNE